MLTIPPELLDPAGVPLDPALAVALRDGGESLGDLLDPVATDVYRLPMVDPDWASALGRAVADLEARARSTGRPVRSPNSMHSYGVLAADLGLDPLIARLVHEVVRPLAATVFPEVGGAGLDHHHGFVVHYGDAHDHDLSLHVDDSEVTLNLCLGDEFDGGELLMSGRRCGDHLQSLCRPGERVALHQEPGVALIHAGMHRHEALPLRRGERLNLIVWCRSSELRRTPQPRCPDWCGAPSRTASSLG